MHLSTTLLRPCPICASRSVEFLHRQDFAAPLELQAPPSYDVVACDTCGLVYANQAVSQQTMDEVYEAHSKYAAEVDEADSERASSGDVAVDPPWDVERLAGVSDYLNEQIGDKSLRVLDAGCSNGTFLAFLRDRGFTNLLGLDPSRSAVANARKYLKLDAVRGSFVSPPPDIGRFDLVTLSHVLEHLTDVNGAVRSIYGLLNDGGLAYIEVPDATRFADYLVAPFHDFNTEHINHFSLELLRELMARHGFEGVHGGAKAVRCSPVDGYPAIYGLWKKRTGARSENFEGVDRDERLVRELKRYIDDSQRLMRQIDTKLEDDLAGHEHVIVWGAGQLTMKLLRDTVLSKKSIAAVVDSSAQRQGMHVDDFMIQSPAALAPLPAYPVVVGSLHHELSIVDTIRDKFGLSNPTVRLFRR